MIQPVAVSLSEKAERAFELQRANRAALKARTGFERRARLLQLRAAIVEHADEIGAALHEDLRKPALGLETIEVVATLKDIDDALENLDRWMQPDVYPVTAGGGVADARVVYEPRGVVLLFGPWNFPFSLVMQPLVPIIAAGNAVIVKPNELQPRTSAVTAKILRAVFPESEVAVFEGDVALADALLELPFDHIFFTGSPAIGRRIMAAAAKHLCSVTLELGGKCPAILDQGVNIVDAAAKIAAARFFNAGQLCLAVDHVWLHESQQDEFVNALREVVHAGFYADGKLVSQRLSRIVNHRNLKRVEGYIEDALSRGGRIAFGGQIDEDDLTIHPTALIDVPPDARVMQDEIFGPVLPILTYRNEADLHGKMNATGKPLAMYIFSPRETFIDALLLNSSSGGVTVNGVLSHAADNRLPFGGVNQSGIGRYKGVHGFRELSHARSVVTHSAVTS